MNREFEISELRQDLVSGEWIIIAPHRLRRSSDLIKKIVKRKISPRSDCPFENPEKSGQEKAVLVYPERGKWELQIIPNKFPAFLVSLS